MKGTVLPLEGLNAKEQKRLMVLNRMMGGWGFRYARSGGYWRATERRARGSLGAWEPRQKSIQQAR